VTKQDKSWISSRFGRMSTGLKMLLILSLWLFPLGLIAILASVDSARRNSEERNSEALARLEIKAQRINATLARSALTIGTASTAISLSPQASEVCARTLRRLEQGPAPARYALFAGKTLRCASQGFVPPTELPAARDADAPVRIDPQSTMLIQYVFGEGGTLEGIAEYPRASLSQLTYIPGTSRNFDLALSQGGRTMVLRDEFDKGPFGRTVRGREPVANGQLQLDMTLSAVPVSAAEVTTILLPVLMWLFAGIIGWAIVHRLLLRPLERMQRAVSAYRPGDRNLNLPILNTPAREIGELGLAFDQVTRTVARHEAELEAAIERQTRLVREVHHRVKNNLQVVASLLNLHSRGSPNEQVAAAYASIQRRVDALAVVHRNHYAELEENRGVALKPLISELSANLRGTAPQAAAHMPITLNLEPVYANQDVAVSVAFLITELVEFVMFCGAAPVAITLTPKGPTTAALSIASDSLKAGTVCDEKLFDRFDRIVTGLSRQLRSAMNRDLEEGCYSLDIAIAEDRGGT
jgi:signal transduction histidine kinase